jgi:3-oxoacyl-[acyl-carrier protein] reductase
MRQGRIMAATASFSGRVALVTGGSRGIGRAIALALADAGADVAVNYRTQAQAAADVVAAINGKGRRAVAAGADVSDAAAVARMIAEVAAALGPVDILINNAGVATRRAVDNLTEADFDETIRVNLKSAFLCTQAALPHMRAQKWGRIVNISSGAARGSGGIGLHYNASKAGLEGLTRGYAARLVKDGVTVNAVAPSQIESDMVPAATYGHASHIPMGRLGQAEEVAQITVAVAANAYMTGQTVMLNGGTNFI